MLHILISLIYTFPAEVSRHLQFCTVSVIKICTFELLVYTGWHRKNTLNLLRCCTMHLK